MKRDDAEFMQRISRDLRARKAACKILGVEENADKQQLKKAYRKAAVEYHPDHKDNNQESNRKFVLIKCAYELLAFDKSCLEILEEIDSWPGVSNDNKYKTDNTWGHFLWWREKFFNPDKEKRKPNGSKRSSCI